MRFSFLVRKRTKMPFTNVLGRELSKRWHPWPSELAPAERKSRTDSEHLSYKFLTIQTLITHCQKLRNQIDSEGEFKAELGN